MKFFSLILTVFLLSGFGVFSQEKYAKHIVVRGETISEIAEKYKVKTSAIYEINPDSKKGIKAKTILLIPNSANKNKKDTKEITVNYKDVTHIVLAGQTLFGIAKQYNLTVNDLYKANPTLKKDKLEIDQKVIIPIKELNNQDVIALKELPNTKQDVAIIDNELSVNEVAIKTVSFNENENAVTEATRVILAGETKYGIAKEYGITVKELERQNPAIVSKFPEGYKLTINSTQLLNSTKENKEQKLVETALLNKDENSISNIDLIEKLINTASDKIGTRYRSGGTTIEGFDCSGLMFNTFGAFNILLPRSSFEQSHYGVKINTGDAKKGDLIFFKTNGRGKINHVGMVVEVLDDEIKFIHSSNHSGVIVSSTKESYYDKNLVQVNRVL